jgi:hypothetical protein
VNERNLARTLSESVVEALKSLGHILVVKGGSTALAREFEERMAPELAKIAPLIEPRALMGGEPTSTFGSESIDDAVEEMVAELTQALMDSDHVEDVFAEDNVIRRDVFRSIRDGLLRAPVELSPAEEPVRARLDTLGYVAATVAKLASPATLNEVLKRAASQVAAQFTAYDADAREATFLLEEGEPDGRLELEEAIADALTDLVEQGVVDLPTIERSIDVGRPLSPAEQRALLPRIDAAGKARLLQRGCVASWEWADPRTLGISFTPLSDQDAREVDQYLGAFAHDVVALVGEGKEKAARSSRTGAAAPPPSGRTKAAAKAEPVEVEPEEAPPPPAKAPPAAPSPAKAPRAKASAKTASKRAAESEPARAPKAAASAKKATAKKAAAKGVAKKTTAKKR